MSPINDNDLINDPVVSAIIEVRDAVKALDTKLNTIVFTRLDGLDKIQKTHERRLRLLERIGYGLSGVVATLGVLATILGIFEKLSIRWK